MVHYQGLSSRTMTKVDEMKMVGTEQEVETAEERVSELLPKAPPDELALASVDISS